MMPQEQFWVIASLIMSLIGAGLIFFIKRFITQIDALSSKVDSLEEKFVTKMTSFIERILETEVKNLNKFATKEDLRSLCRDARKGGGGQ